MFLDGRKTFTSSKLLAKRRRVLDTGFDIDMRHILDQTDCNDDELIETLTSRHTLEPLVISPTRFAGQGFHEVHKGVPGLTERFFAFNRDVPYKGDQALWFFSSTDGGCTDLRMRFTSRGDATIHGVCTEAECQTIDVYLEQQIDYLRRFVLPAASYLVEHHNKTVSERAATFVSRYAASIDRYRNEAAANRKAPA